MSTDHELLKRAAKSAGITLIRWNETYASYETSSGLWNPYLNDGDALRLAVKLSLLVLPYPDDKAVRVTRLDQPDTIVSWGSPPEPNAATRLAIVRAAAEIG